MFRYLFLFLPLYLSAQSIPDFLSVPFPTELIVNKQGDKTAWVFNDAGSRNIYIAESPSYQSYPITQFNGDDGMEISNLSFSPDGMKLLFVRGNPLNKAGLPANPAQLQESTERHIYVLHLKDKAIIKIAKGYDPTWSPDGSAFVFIQNNQVYQATWQSTGYAVNPYFKANGSVSQLRYAPNGKWLAFRLLKGMHAYIGIYSLEEKKVFFPDPSADRDSDPVWHPSLDKLAFIRIAPVRFNLPFSPKREAYPWQIRVVDLSNQSTGEIWRADVGMGSVFNEDLPVTENKLLWTKSGFLLFPWEKSGWLHVYARNEHTGEVKDLTPGEGEVENWGLSLDQQSLYISSNHADINRRHIRKINIDKLTTEIKVGGKNIAWKCHELKDGFVYLKSTAQEPAWPYIQTNGKEQALARALFPDNFPASLVEPETVTIEATDGFISYGQLLKPPHYQKGTRYPAIIFLHGGSRRQMFSGFHHGLYYSHAYALNQYFASKGYIVLTLNYRSGIGYGLHFREAENYGATGASEVKDVIGSAHFLRNRGDVDATKISLWGGSYGGYLTAHALAQRSELFLTGVDIHGVHNWNDEIPTFAPWYDPVKYPVAADLAFKSSPEYFIDGWKAPVLFIHGDDDRNVPFNETVYFIEKLRRKNINIEQLVFPDEVHSFLMHRHWIKAYQATFDFIQKHTWPEK
jgi:dipeptidyl aminopeptidase/acylaminoacyl peptidase